MENYKQIGVWIDHSKAHLIGFKSGQAKLLETVDSPYESIKRIDGEGKDMTRFSPNPEHASNNEHKKHNTTQNEINEYLRMMEHRLQPFEDILLFGPGTMKEKLKNRLKENKSFDGKWLSVESSDKLTDNQLLAFVRDFYKKESV
ncbi:MAG: hypothetical protein ACK4SF_20120 [Algoriphagus aquaeductus]|uniref:Protein required for attachment to host cells n=1 Tax=Algoriphagus aquaeductus TaxID=475299 RepID=A0A326RIW5_9BACT|nr:MULTISPECIES: hypothetical protein [Algoriphagus]PZV76725.1 hypothetical protein CLV31_1237 [Algoriphagus aquaeductus]